MNNFKQERDEAKLAELKRQKQEINDYLKNKSVYFSPDQARIFRKRRRNINAQIIYYEKICGHSSQK